jgi:uncharacterized protein (TIGR02246 family)
MSFTTVIRRAVAGGFVSMSVAALLPAQDAAKDVRKLEDQWITIAMKRDGAALGKMLADDMLVIDDGKPSSKASVVDGVTNEKRNLVSFSYSGVNTRVYGNTVVINGVTNITTKETKGNVTTRWSWTDTWVKQNDGRWLCVASHGSPAK